MHASANQCGVLLTLAQRACGDLDDSHLALQPAAGIKTAGWLIGHLAVTGDFARKLCGQRPLCPAEWRALFNPGSVPATTRDAYPPMLELRTAMLAVYADLRVAAVAANETQLAAENPFTAARSVFPTTGSFVEYMLTGHLAYHLGQLVSWRAAAGMGRLAGGGFFSL